jgi:predicted MFS family arabinose efflux permease
MICYSIGSATGSILSTLIYARAGWDGVCAAGGAVSLVAFIFWWRTRPTAAS